MNKTVTEALALVRDLRGLVSQVRDRVEVLIAPPFTALHPVAKALEGSNIGLAAQNCHWEASGAFTGEVSAAMLKDVGCDLRHPGPLASGGSSSARPTPGSNAKARAVVKAGLTPIICVGETLAGARGEPHPRGGRRAR